VFPFESDTTTSTLLLDFLFPPLSLVDDLDLDLSRINPGRRTFTRPLCAYWSSVSCTRLGTHRASRRSITSRTPSGRCGSALYSKKCMFAGASIPHSPSLVLWLRQPSSLLLLPPALLLLLR
jgi:hypothetical protein